MVESSEVDVPVAAGVRGVPTGVRGVRILGMHRSGTSYVAGSFAAAGYYVGTGSALMAPAPDNPLGFFERRDVSDLNDELLGRLGASWSSPPAPDVVLAHAPRLSAEVGDVFGSIIREAAGNPIVLKDPRLSLLLPVWDSVSGEDLLDVVVIRNPLDIAASLRRRNGFPVHFSLALWHLYTVSLLKSLRGRPLLVANFDRLSSSRTAREAWELAAGKEFRRLGLPFPELDGFSYGNKHYRSRESELLVLASADQLRLWRFLEGLETSVAHLDPPADLLEWPSSSATLVLELGLLLEGADGEPVELESVGEELQRLDREREEAASRAERAEAEREEAAGRAERAEAEREEAAGRAERAEAEREEAAGRAERAEAEREEAAGRAERAEAEREEAAGRAERAEAEREEAAGRAERAEAEREEAAGRAERAEAEREEVRESLAAECEALRANVLAGEAERARLQREVADDREALELRVLLTAETERRGELERVSRELSDELLHQRVEVLTLGEALEDANQAHGRATTELGQALAELEAQGFALRSMQDALTESQVKLEIVYQRLAVVDRERGDLVVQGEHLLMVQEHLRAQLLAAHERLAVVDRERGDLVVQGEHLLMVQEHLRAQLVAVHAEAQSANDAHTAALAALVSSRSWRVTRPLRALLRALRGGRPRAV